MCAQDVYTPRRISENLPRFVQVPGKSGYRTSGFRPISISGYGVYHVQREGFAIITNSAESLWRGCSTIRQFYPDFASGWRGVQSFGGKATRQNVGLGSMNSTPTRLCSPEILSTWTTTHSSAAFVWIFDRLNSCPRYIGAATAINAPWALIAKV